MNGERYETGGPAFPYKIIDHQTSDCHGGLKTVYKEIPGMTLRDYFAGQVLAGIYTNRICVVYNHAAEEVIYRPIKC